MNLSENLRSDHCQNEIQIPVELDPPTNPEEDEDEYNFGYRRRFPWMSGGTKVDYPLPCKISSTGTDQQRPSSEIPKLVIEIKRNPSGKGWWGYCAICDANSEHDEFDCPRREEATGTFCMYCYGPCQNEWKGKHGKLILKGVIKSCILCGAKADHWAIDCPSHHCETENEDNSVPDFDEDGF